MNVDRHGMSAKKLEGRCNARMHKVGERRHKEGCYRIMKGVPPKSWEAPRQEMVGSNEGGRQNGRDVCLRSNHVSNWSELLKRNQNSQ